MDISLSVTSVFGTGSTADVTSNAQSRFASGGLIIWFFLSFISVIRGTAFSSTVTVTLSPAHGDIFLF